MISDNLQSIRIKFLQLLNVKILISPLTGDGEWLANWAIKNISIIEIYPNHYFILNLLLEKTEFVTKSKIELDDYLNSYSLEEVKNLFMFHSSILDIEKIKKKLQ